MTLGMFHFPLDPELACSYLVGIQIVTSIAKRNHHVRKFSLNLLSDAEELFEHLFTIPFPQFEYPRLYPFFNLFSYLT